MCVNSTRQKVKMEIVGKWLDVVGGELAGKVEGSVVE